MEPANRVANNRGGVSSRSNHGVLHEIKFYGKIQLSQAAVLAVLVEENGFAGKKNQRHSVTSISLHTIQPGARLPEEKWKLNYVSPHSSRSVMAPVQDNPPPDIAMRQDDTSVVVVTVVMTLVATIFIGLRLYGCVYILRRRLYLEEWLSVINQVRLDRSLSDLANLRWQNEGLFMNAEAESLTAQSPDRPLADRSLRHEPVCNDRCRATLGNAV